MVFIGKKPKARSIMISNGWMSEVGVFFSTNAMMPLPFFLKL